MFEAVPKILALGWQFANIKLNLGNGYEFPIYSFSLFPVLVAMVWRLAFYRLELGHVNMDAKYDRQYWKNYKVQIPGRKLLK
jgi:hypothetical protein